MELTSEHTLPPPRLTHFDLALYLASLLSVISLLICAHGLPFDLSYNQA